MTALPNRQRGLGVTGWLFVIAIGLFVAIMAMKMVPAYLNFYTLSKILEDMGRDHELAAFSPRDIRGVFQKRVSVNSVYDLPPKAFKVARDKDGRRVMVLDYSVTQPLAGNVEVVMHFHKEVPVPKRR